jgi:pimeloyl-ACP methyl ester carboxylesterase
MSDKLSLDHSVTLVDLAQPRRWTVPNTSPCGGELVIAGWEFGDDSKPTAMLHHANGMCAATWALVAAKLAENYHVFAVDARGHGDSSRLTVPDDYHWDCFVNDLVQVSHQVLAETGQDSIRLGVGSSFGGIVTAGAQAAHGQLFDQIVMLDPPVHPTEEIVAALGLGLVPEASGQREQLVNQTLRRRAIWASREEARIAWQDKPLFASWHPDAFELYLSEGFEDLPDGQVALKCEPTVEAHIFGTTGSLGVLDYAPNVNIPVKLVHAALGFFPEDFFRVVAGLFPQGEFDTMAGGHLLPLEVPELVAEYLLAL